jgi:D-beta-D-heptose 7-phosphate kinase/D-beta-D-heptose 1-phosphate adenosyltransferase
MVDRFLWGRVDRISPEAPVPVVRLERETIKLGGAANVAANIRALGAQVMLCGVWGEDEAAGQMRGLLVHHDIDAEGMVANEDRPTTIKTRIIAHSQQVVRADREDDTPLADEEVGLLLEKLGRAVDLDGIILSDYGKGVLTDLALQEVISLARERGIPCVVDPKKGDYSQYHGVTSLTPNQKEAEQACALSICDEEGLDEAGRRLLKRTGSDAVLITRGEHGMALYQADGPVQHLPTEATMVYDVTGAGDTVIAAYTTALAGGADFLDAAALANHAAGLAVRELGTAAVTADQLLHHLGEEES